MILLTQHRWVLPADLNTQNVLFGGRMLEWVDQDCSMACYKILKDETQLVTAGMDRTAWVLAVPAGERLKFTYQLAHIGKSTITVYVAVENSKGQPVFHSLVTLVCISHTRTPSECSFWLNPEHKGLGDVLHSLPLWRLVEKIRQERSTDEEWART
jgi:acyl-CoA thioesterase YciA